MLASSRPRDSNNQWELPRTAYGSFRPLNDRTWGKREFGDTTEPFLKSDRYFHSRQPCSEAPVNSHSERDVRVRSAIDDDSLRIGEPFGVAIGCWKCQKNSLAFLEMATVDLSFFDHLARRRYRSISAKKLFDRSRDQLGFGDKPFSIFIVGSEMP